MQDVLVLEKENWRIEGVVCQVCSEVREGKTKSQREREAEGWRGKARKMKQGTDRKESILTGKSEGTVRGKGKKIRRIESGIS